MPILLAAATEATGTLPMPPAVYGLSALAFFAVLLGVTLSFHNVSNKH